jgi:hypothetical protein
MEAAYKYEYFVNDSVPNFYILHYIDNIKINAHPLSAKVGTTSPRNGGRSVGIVR